MNRRRKQKYKLRISSVTENLEIIREFVNRLALHGGFNQEMADQIELAVDEACTNVIKHAYKYDPKRMIDIAVFLDKIKMEIIVSDRGKGFEVAELQKPDLEKYVHESRSGGLGIHLMRSLMDEVNFRFHPGKRNEVSLIKYINLNAV
jgi:serine/threonine-protein kinase RsbW